MLFPQTNPGGYRIVILEIFEVVCGLGRFGRMLKGVLHGYGRSGRASERLLDGLGGMLGGLSQVLCAMLGPKMAAKSGSYRKKCCSRWQKVPQRFLMDFASKISSPGNHKICI